MGSKSFTSRGFTLPELMIVLALAGTILALGAPNFTEFRRNARLTSAGNDFLGAVQSARTEAIKRQAIVSLCATDDPQADTPTCSGGTDFRGWVVFADPDGDCDLAAAADKLRAGWSGGSGAVSIEGNANGTCMSFGGNGFPRTAPVANARRVVFCDERGFDNQAGTDQSAARGIEMSPAGRSAVTRVPATLIGWGIACGP
jgi:type IV fimbrial biogenesis protein FimT